MTRRGVVTRGSDTWSGVAWCGACGPSPQLDLYLATFIASGRDLDAELEAVNTSPDALHPETRASFLSRLTFSWMTALVLTGYKRPLQMNDVAPLKSAFHSGVASRAFEHHWHEEMQKGPKKASLLRALWRTCGGYYMLAVPLLCIQNAVQFAPPIILRRLITCMSRFMLRRAVVWSGVDPLSTALIIVAGYRRRERCGRRARVVRLRPVPCHLHRPRCVRLPRLAVLLLVFDSNHASSTVLGSGTDCQ